MSRGCPAAAADMQPRTFLRDLTHLTIEELRLGFRKQFLRGELNSRYEVSYGSLQGSSSPARQRRSAFYFCVLSAMFKSLISCACLARLPCSAMLPASSCRVPRSKS